MNTNAQRRILVIDDDPELLTLLEFLLPNHGFCVKTCNTGERLFDQIEEFKPNLILLDINLGDRDGRDLCRAIKASEETLTIPVIMISADDDIYNTIESFGANDVISKPFSFTNLTSRIERQILQSPN